MGGPGSVGRGWVYFTAGSGCWRVSTAIGFTEECLAHFGDVPMIVALIVALPRRRP